MTHLLIALCLWFLLAPPAFAAPGDPRFLQGTVEWPTALTAEPILIVRGDDGRVYSADVAGARRQGPDAIRVGGRVALLVIEGARPHDVTAIVLGAGDSVSLARALSHSVTPGPSASAAAAAAPPVAIATLATPAGTTPAPTPPAPAAQTPPAPAAAPGVVVGPLLAPPATSSLTPARATMPAAALAQPSPPAAAPAAAPTPAPAAAAIAPSAPGVTIPAVPAAPAVTASVMTSPAVPAPKPATTAPPASAAPPAAATAAPPTSTPAAAPPPAASIASPSKPTAVAPPTPAPNVPARPAAPPIERKQWARIDGKVQSVEGALLVLKADNGSLVLVDISQLNPNVSQALRRGRAVSVYGYPLEQRFEAAGYIELDASHPEPPRLRYNR